MTKIKVWRDDTSIRYEGKQYVQFVGRFGQEYAQKVAPLVRKQWEAKFNQYRVLYEALKDFFEKYNAEHRANPIPKGQYGLYRSFLFYAWKHIQTGSDPNDVIERFANNLGLDRAVMREILRYFHLDRRPTRETVKTNAEVGSQPIAPTGTPTP